MRLVGQRRAQQIKASAKANSSDDESVLVLSDTDAFSLPFASTVFVFAGPFKGSSPGLKGEGFWSCFPRSRQHESTILRLLGERTKCADTCRLSVPTEKENLSPRQVKNNQPPL